MLCVRHAVMRHTPMQICKRHHSITSTVTPNIIPRSVAGPAWAPMENSALGFQPPLLTLDANRVLRLATKKVPSILERTRALLQLVSFYPEHSLADRWTYHAAKATHMPLRSQSLNYRIRNRLPALPTLGTEAVRMAPHTPSIPLLLDKWRRRIKWITALSAEEMSNMPLGATSHDNLALDRRLAALAAGREELVEVEMAVEAHSFVEPVFSFETLHILVRGVGLKELDVITALASMNATDALSTLVIRFRVEGYTF
jgi:hypothetical protein